MPFEHINGTDIFHLEVGQGLPCIVMHGGLGVDHTQFRESLDPLGDVLRLVYLEQSGHYPFVEEPESFRSVLRDWFDRRRSQVSWTPHG